MNELKLICSLFDQEVEHTLGFLSSLEEKEWNLVSHPWDSILFHKLAKNISVAEIVNHIVMFEHYVVNAIGTQKNGAILSIEGDETLCEKIKKRRDIVVCYREVHEENLGRINGFHQSDLEKRLTFIDQPYNGVGLLWILIGHHAFHLGQLRSMIFPRTE